MLSRLYEAVVRPLFRRERNDAPDAEEEFRRKRARVDAVAAATPVREEDLHRALQASGAADLRRPSTVLQYRMPTKTGPQDLSRPSRHDTSVSNLPLDEQIRSVQRTTPARVAANGSARISGATPWTQPLPARRSSKVTEGLLTAAATGKSAVKRPSPARSHMSSGLTPTSRSVVTSAPTLSTTDSSVAAHHLTMLQVFQQQALPLSAAPQQPPRFPRRGADVTLLSHVIRSDHNREDDDEDVGPAYAIDDALVTANLFSQIAVSSSADLQREELTWLQKLEQQDAEARALYDFLVLNAVTEAVRDTVVRRTGETEGAIEALIRSVVAPIVIERCPRPRGVLKQLRKKAVVSLPLSLDDEDKAMLNRVLPPLPAQAPVSSSFLASIANAAGRWLGAVLPGASPPSGGDDEQHSPEELEFVIDDDGYQIRRYQLRTLLGDRWVNDQVVNYYFHLLSRSFPDIVSLGSHLYRRLQTGDVQGALRWVRKKDIFSCRCILIGINLSQSHWTLVVVDNETRHVKYLDSAHGVSSYETVLDRVTEFLDEAYAAKHDGKRPPVSYKKWRRNTDPEFINDEYFSLPKQANYHDCGVFVTQFAMCAASGIAADFSQEDITLLRNVTALELSHRTLLRRMAR